MKKPNLSFAQIITMNVGFLGIQYSFGLQQTAINPIYSFLGANPDQLPLLNLAGPLTGLLIQPLIGAISDRSWSDRWGRRKPFFFIGAIFCSLALFIYPFSRTLWMAVGLLWVLDVANNTAMEPYRAFVADKLNSEQQGTGFLTQSFFTGLGITLANISLFVFQKLLVSHAHTAAHTIPLWVYGSFFVGGVVSVTSVLFSLWKTPEIRPSEEELAILRAQKGNMLTPFVEIFEAIKHMPKIMWQLALVYIFQWYALFCYWQFVSLSLSKTIFNGNFEEAVGWSGIVNGFYNIVTFLVALRLATFIKKYQPKYVHAICLVMAGISLMIFPFITQKYLSLLPMIGLGVAWASIMGVPYLIVVSEIPKEKYGVYMGIINMMIVLPMLFQTVSFKYIYHHLLHAEPQYAILFAGILLLIAAFFTLRISTPKRKNITGLM